MENSKRFAAFLGILTTIVTVAANLAFAREESIGVLFERSLLANPNEYAAIREEITGKGRDALVILEERRSETSNWYEKAIAGSLILAIAWPEKYHNYQEEFDKWACTGGVPRWNHMTRPHPWRKSRIISEGPNTVPFLIEKLFKDLPEKMRDSTVKGWHLSHPVATAAVFLQSIGGNDAARAVATILLETENVRQDYDELSYITASKRRGQEILKLSRLSDRELGTAMIGLLKKDSFVPIAAWVLGELRDTRAIQPLIDTNSSFSATALAKIGESALPALIEALGSPKRETRSLADAALARMGSVAVPPLSKLLYDGTGVAQIFGTEYHAVRALRFIGDSRGVPALIKSLESDYLSVVGEAATALGEIGDPAAKEPLVKALENPRNWHSTSIFGIAGALAAFKEPDAFPRLSVLAKDENWYLRRAAIGALPAVGGEKSLSILLELVNHEHKATRGDAAIALGKLGDPRAVPALIEALSDPESFIISSAAWSLGEIGDPRALPYLRKMASRTKEHLQGTANEAIRKIEAEGSKSNQ